ncbi:MAG: glycosyltransferase family 4 protein, partial [Chloroflexota bacterium]|nr:glycosyltransferase family 4 protein [Chloroflexota bacterium]
GQYALFVGRLSPEKGIGTLLKAWQRLGETIPLKIVGDGPLAADVADAQRQMPGVEWLGRLAPAATTAAMQDAALLIFPSEWYEAGLARTILESFAAGTPVVTPRLGTMRDLIQDGETGLHFRAGDPDDLARVVADAFSRPDALARMRGQARAEFDARYTAEENYHHLMEIYRGVTRKEDNRSTSYSDPTYGTNTEYTSI